MDHGRGGIRSKKKKKVSNEQVRTLDYLQQYNPHDQIQEVNMVPPLVDLDFFLLTVLEQIDQDNFFDIQYAWVPFIKKKKKKKIKKKKKKKKEFEKKSLKKEMRLFFNKILNRVRYFN